MNNNEMYYRVYVTRTVVETVEILVTARPGATYEDMQQAIRKPLQEDVLDKKTERISLDKYDPAGRLPFDWDV